MTERTDTVGWKMMAPGFANLMKKDLAVFIPRDRFLVGLVFVLAHPMVLPSREAFFWLGVALAAALAAYVPVVEWHQETDRMLSSLPVRRRTIVLARYGSSFLAIAVSAVAWLSAGWILDAFMSTQDELAFGAGWGTVPGVLTYGVMAGVLVSLFLPLYFRFAMGKAVVFFTGLCLGSYALAAVRLGLFPPATRLEGVFLEWTQAMGPGWVLVGSLALLAAVVAASGTSAVRGFRSRDL